MNRFRTWFRGLQPKAQQRVRLGVTITTLLFVVLVIVLVFRGCPKTSHPPARPVSTTPATPTSTSTTTPTVADTTAKPSPVTKPTSAKPSVDSRLETLVKGLAEKVNNLIGRVTDLGKQQEATTGEVKTLSGKVEKVEGRLNTIEKRPTTLPPPPTPPALTPAEPEADEEFEPQPRRLPPDEELREWGGQYLRDLRRRDVQPRPRARPTSERL